MEDKKLNAGRVGLTMKGAWNASQSYEKLNCVSHNGRSWAAKKNVSAGVEPSAANSEFWQMMSDRGEQGIQGPTGPQGNSAFDGTGVEIVNNLTQGGEAAVLSAEQGKILKQELTELESEVGVPESYKSYAMLGNTLFLQPLTPTDNPISVGDKILVRVDSDVIGKYILQDEAGNRLVDEFLLANQEYILTIEVAPTSNYGIIVTAANVLGDGDVVFKILRNYEQSQLGKINTLSDASRQIQGSITKIESSFENYKRGFIIRNTGELEKASLGAVTDRIEVNGGDVCIWTYKALVTSDDGANKGCIVEFDETMGIVDYWFMTESGSKKISLNKATKYIVASISLSDIQDCSVSVNDSIVWKPMSIETTKETISDIQKDIFDINGKCEPIVVSYNVIDANRDIIDAELSASTGRVIASSSTYRVTDMVSVASGDQYKSNKSLFIYFYDDKSNYLGRFKIEADTLFELPSEADKFRTEWNYGIDANPLEIVRLRDGIRQANYRFNGSIVSNIASNSNVLHLPNKDSNIEVKFRTSFSLFAATEELELGHFDGIVNGSNITNGKISISPISKGDNIFYDNSSLKLSFVLADNTQEHDINYNIYGADLFSLRLRYPICSVNDNGLTSIVTPCPSEWQGGYIEKTDNSFTIYYGNGQPFKTYSLANITYVTELVDILTADDELQEFFEVKRYGGDGVLLTAINNFAKIYINKQHTEYYFVSEDTLNATPTGNTYYDAYPVFIRSNDIDYEHTLTMSYRITDGKFISFQVILDGIYLKHTEYMPFMIANEATFTLNSDAIDVINIKTSEYRKVIPPMIVRLHDIVESDEIKGETAKVSTRRMYDIMRQLESRGFTSVSLHDSFDSVKGGHQIIANTYCLTFDDYRIGHWRNRNIRSLLSMFRSKPTLFYIIRCDHMDESPNADVYPTREEVDAMMKSGWRIESHGFTMYTYKMSYAQFVYGFAKTKDIFNSWYGYESCLYTPHGEDVWEYQYFTLRHMGYSMVGDPTNRLSLPCVVGTTFDCVPQRITWLDSEQDWDMVMKQIEEFHL